MTESDYKKIINAGFIIIRSNELKLEIRNKDMPVWRVFEEFEKKEDLEKRKQQLLQLSIVVEY